MRVPVFSGSEGLKYGIRVLEAEFSIEILTCKDAAPYLTSCSLTGQHCRGA